MLKACGRSGRQSVQQWLRLVSPPHDFASVHPEEALVRSVAGWLGFGSNALVPNLSPTLASLLSLRRAASSDSDTLPAKFRSRGAAGNSVKAPAGRTAVPDEIAQLPIAGGSLPRIVKQESKAAELLGSKAKRLLDNLEALEPGSIGAAVSAAIEKVGQPGSEGQLEGGGPRTPAERFDEVLEEWGELLDEGEAETVMELMGQQLGAGSRDLFAPLAELDEQGKEEGDAAGRRALQEELRDQVAKRRVRMVDQLGRAYATGKRKTSIARVWIREPPEHRRGLGRIIANGRPFDDYFKPMMARRDVLAPFDVTSNLGKFDVKVVVHGGGFSGQAQAVRHGISKALQLWDPELRPALKARGFLTRDSRIVERKKPGKAKARKSFQWVKR